MKIHHIRNATFVFEFGNNYVLVDPMLSKKGKLPPYTFIKHKPKRNPIVDLPPNTEELLKKVNWSLITHCQKLGLKILQHTDHLDYKGEEFLRDQNIPVTSLLKDKKFLVNKGINVASTLKYMETKDFFNGKITAVPAKHGNGWITNLMANGAGYFIELPGEPTLYISGDTVLTKDVKRVVLELKPDISVMASGGASLDIGKPILMDISEQMEFVRMVKGMVISNHLEALNHCPVTRDKLKKEIEYCGLKDKVIIPSDGETIIF